MEVSVLNKNGQDTGKKVTLLDSIFAIEPNDHAIYLDVKQYLAAQRQGTAKTKERSEMSGSTRKLGRQKGGGGARRGDINSPVLVGGARVFGPKPRDYDFKLNKKVKQLARKSALSYKAKESAVIVVEDLNGIDKNMFLSARNLKKANVTTANQLNTYGILDAGVLVLTESALKDIEAVLNK